jgi:hypothetical protein
MLGYEGITITGLRRVAGLIEGHAEQMGLMLTHRNRAAHRRKPCAFHWLDSNWCWIGGLFVMAVRMVLGETRGVRPKGRKKRTPLPMISPFTYS